jgi:hypothetical protein
VKKWHVGSMHFKHERRQIVHKEYSWQHCCLLLRKKKYEEKEKRKEKKMKIKD